MYNNIFSIFSLSMASTSPVNPSALIFRVDEKNPFFTFKEEILSKLTDEKCSRMPIIDGFLKIRRCEVTKSVAGVPLAPPGFESRLPCNKHYFFILNYPICYPLYFF